jgi:hypothetical protein
VDEEGDAAVAEGATEVKDAAGDEVPTQTDTRHIAIIPRFDGQIVTRHTQNHSLQ